MPLVLIDMDSGTIFKLTPWVHQQIKMFALKMTESENSLEIVHIRWADMVSESSTIWFLGHTHARLYLSITLIQMIHIGKILPSLPISTTLSDGRTTETELSQKKLEM
jgi:hypothetical protein